VSKRIAYEPTDAEWAHLFVAMVYPNDTEGIREVVRSIIDNAQAEADAPRTAT
jgi:hypothetical protein